LKNAVLNTLVNVFKPLFEKDKKAIKINARKWYQHISKSRLIIDFIHDHQIWRGYKICFLK